MELNYKKLGQGRPLLILHGLFGSLDNWMTLGRRFAENHEVYLIDQRNHGQSPHTDEFSYELLCADLVEFIQSHGIEDAILVGHSMGGKTVMKLAIDHPELLGKLVVVDAAPKSYPVHHNHILAALNALNFDLIKSRKQADELLEGYIPDMGTRMFILKNIYWQKKDRLGLRFNLKSLHANIEAISAWPETDEIYGGPTLFIRGGASNYVDVPDPSVEQYFPHAEVQTIEGAGHWVHAVAPDEFYEAVSEFAIAR